MNAYTTFPRTAPFAMAALANLGPIEHLDALGELLEPSLHGPVILTDEHEALMDALMPVIAAYRAVYPALTRAVAREGCGA